MLNKINYNSAQRQQVSWFQFHVWVHGCGWNVCRLH